MSDKKVDLQEHGSVILEANGPVRFVEVDIPKEGKAWVSPADAYMLDVRGQHQCVCAAWEEWEECIAWKGDVCIKTKLVRKCVEWHCNHKP